MAQERFPIKIDKQRASTSFSTPNKSKSYPNVQSEKLSRLRFNEPASAEFYMNDCISMFFNFLNEPKLP